MGDDICKLCKEGYGFLHDYLKSDEADEMIKQALEELCTILPISDCKSTMDPCVKQLIKAFVDTMDPNTFCKELGLCDSNSVRATRADLKEHSEDIPAHPWESEDGSNEKRLFSKALSPVELLPAKEEVQTEEAGNPVTCEVCEYAMQYLDSMLSDNATEEEIKAALEQLCGLLPSSVSSECTSLVNQYSDTIIKLIVQELADPKTICTQLKLCTSSNSARAMRAPAGLKVLLKYGEDIPTHPCCQRSHTNRYSCFSQEWTGFKASRDPYDHTAEIAQYEEKLSQFDQGIAAKLNYPAEVACSYWMGGEGK